MSYKTLSKVLKGIFTIMFSVLVSGCASAPPPPENDESVVNEKISVSHVLVLRTSPSEEILKHKIYVEFMESPKTTQILRDGLRRHGFEVVSDVKEADLKYYLSGELVVLGPEGQRLSRDLAPILESSIEIKEDEIPEADVQAGRKYNEKSSAHQVGIGTIVLSGAITGFTSSLTITNMVDAFSNMIGVKGLFKKSSYCAHPSCRVYTTGAVVYVKDEKGVEHWIIKALANSRKVSAHLVIPEAMDNILNPIYDIKPRDGRESSSKPQTQMEVK
jgi:hypothetical protein